MTLWERIRALLAEAQDRTLGAVMDAMERRRKSRDAAIFSIALIALSAKMAKADGVVTDDEIAAFRSFFNYPADEESKVRTVFTLAMEDVAGFDSYAKQVGKLFHDEPVILEDVLDCLFFVALADGVLHPQETALLDMAANAFSLNQAACRRIKAAHLGAEKEDPYVILGVDHGASVEEVRRVYRTLAKENHPDALIARGVPEDLVQIAEHRMAVINSAYERAMAELQS
ncbi:TerB family tellurite resistance protein [Parvularcula sp. LCG005]|uniref:TerB family tellurite resistance protein n=1 Tax=Parvularcula sp. LCG005 TaxID=3078805 RepID=UPI002942CE0D|nr:TerB family tellurite resistance protein [Parvularcula sp. LCG005]WOI52356.1 TerB family tellurite resistance protein [Parvularcula sp. LCG005]